MKDSSIWWLTWVLNFDLEEKFVFVQFWLITQSEARLTEFETGFSFTWFGFGFVLIRFRI